MPVVLAATMCFGILTLWVPWYWPVTVFQVAIFALASLAAWRARSYPPYFAYPLIPLTLAACWGLIQLVAGRTAYAFETQKAAVQWATFLAVLVIGLCLFRDEGTRHWFRSSMLWFGFLVAVLATLQTFTSGGKVFWIFPSGYTDFVMGPILSPNHYAAFIEAVLPIAMYEALRSEKRSLLYAVMAGAMYASVIASSSRAGTVLATAEILTVGLLMWFRGHVTGRLVAMSILRIAVLFAVFTVAVGHEGVWARLLESDPMAGRHEFAASSLHMIADHPWFGVGLGVWPTVYPRYATVDMGAFVNQAHNDWLQWAAEGGIPFGIVMASLFIWSIRPAFRTVWGLGAISVGLHALVDYPFSRPALGCWTFLIIAMLAAHAHQYRNINQSSELV